MAKKKIKVSKAAFQSAAFASSLAQLQNRVTQLATDVTVKLAGLQDQVNRAWSLQDSRNAVVVKNNAEIEKFGKNTTASFYALRDSTQKAFTNVANDIQILSDRIFHAVGRLTEIENHLPKVKLKKKKVKR